MKRYWVSWWHPDGTTFELFYPWWISGSRDGEESICAAVLAENENAAREIVAAGYVDCSADGPTEWRFVEERADDWSPFTSRFQRADWMECGRHEH